MKNWKFFCIEVVVLLLIQVSNIHSGCSWNDKSQNNCSINCNSPLSPFIRENIKAIMKELSKLYVEVKPFLKINGKLSQKNNFLA